MPRKPYDDRPVNEEYERQLEAGREMAAREKGEKEQIHDEVDDDLYKLSRLAVKALERQLGPDSRAATTAALGILDRTGHPPVRKVQTVEKRAFDSQSGMLDDAIRALMEIPEEMLVNLVSRMIALKPELQLKLTGEPSPSEIEADYEVVDDGG